MYRHYHKPVTSDSAQPLYCKVFNCVPQDEDTRGFQSKSDFWVPYRSSVDEVPNNPRSVSVPEMAPESGSFFSIDLETGHPWDWDSYLDLSGLSALPFAHVDLGTNFDLDHQTSNIPTVPVSSDLKPKPKEDFPLEIGSELGDSLDGDLNVYLLGSRAPPFASSDLQIDFAIDHPSSNPPNLPATSDPVPSWRDNFLAWCNHPSSSSQFEMISNLPSAPSASTTELPNEPNLIPLRTNVGPSVSHSHSQAPQKPESLPLPPAPHLRCPSCTRKFSSRVRLE